MNATLKTVKQPVHAMYISPVQNVMQKEQSNGLILKSVVVNFLFVNTLDINNFNESMNPDISIIKTHTRHIKIRFMYVIKFYDLFNYSLYSV